jgi:PAS domain S-box-containing protein
MKAVGVHKKLLAVFLATVTVLAVMGVFIRLSLQDREAYRWVMHTYQVQTRLKSALLDVESGQDAHEDYLLNHNGSALATFSAAFLQATIDMDALEDLVSDNPQQTARLHSLRRDIIAYQAVLEVSSRGGALAGRTSPVFVQEFRLLENVHRSADRMKQAEQDLLEQRTRANRWSQRRVNIAFVCFLVAVSLLLVALFVAVRQDLLQQRETERLRHAADQKVVNILENISDAFFALNREWVVTYMNGQAEHVLEKSRAELVGKNLWTVYPEAIDQEFGLQYRRAIQEQATVRFESFDPTRSSWFELRAYPSEDGLGIFITNITERKTAEEERDHLARQTLLHSAAQRRNQELQDLARRLVEMQEAERGHLAHELHEEVGQVLAGLKLSLAGIMKQNDSARENQIRMSQDLVTELMRQVRSLSLDLRPGVLDDLGLLPALEWYCKHYTDQTEVVVDLEAIGLDNRLDGTVETTAYRIVQEALTNVAQHSRVKAVEVRVVLQDERLILQISDRGIGLSLQNADCFCDHSGLTAMQERATLIGGTFELTSAPDQGMTIVADLPIHPIYTSLES